MKAPTERQLEVLAVVIALTQKRGIAPTIEEIGTALGLASKNAVHANVSRLEAKGLISRTPIIARSIRVTAEGRRVHKERTKKGASK